MKRNLCLIGCALLCWGSFVVGRISGQRDIITYSVNEIPTSFNRAWPTYGLPLSEYSLILTIARNGSTDELLRHVEIFLDSAIYDAKCRYPLLTGNDLTSLTKSLQKAAEYRHDFPRSNEGSFDESWRQKQAEIDGFLLQFKTNP